MSIKINHEKCYVDKRALILDCEVTGWFTGEGDEGEQTKHYVLCIDHWGGGEDVSTLSIDGDPEQFIPLTAYKHCIQGWFPADEDRTIFIDRRYEHDHTYNIYYGGEAFEVMASNEKPIK